MKSLRFSIRSLVVAIAVAGMLVASPSRGFPQGDDGPSTDTLKQPKYSVVGSINVTVPAVKPTPTPGPTPTPEPEEPAAPFRPDASSVTADSGSVLLVLTLAAEDANPPTEIAAILVPEGDEIPTSGAAIKETGTTATFSSDGSATVTIPVTPQTTARDVRIVWVGVRYDPLPTE